MDTLRKFTLHAIVLLLLLAQGCSNGGNSSDTAPVNANNPEVGTLQIAHTLDGVAPQESGSSLFSVIRGLDASDNVIYGPLKLSYSAEHTIADVPIAVVRVLIEYRLGTGQLIARANTEVDVQASQTTRVLAVAAGPPNHVTVELINDTDNKHGDEKMFVLFDTPKPTGSAEGIELLTDSGDATANATAAALSTLWPKDKPNQPTFTSPYTGKQRPIYSFTLNDVDSGRLTFSYEVPTSITNGNAPTAASNLRYDKLEITYLNDQMSGGGNLTAIDFFSIPLQVEVLHWGDDTPDPLQTKSFYASTPTMLTTLQRLSPGSMGPAFRNTSNGEYHFPAEGPTNLSDFARVLSPSTIAAATTNGSSAPYPSFGGTTGYLDSLVDNTYTLNGAQYGGYRYTATFARDGHGGYVVHCTGTTTVVPVVPLAPITHVPANADVTLHLPKDKLDFFIYATAANKASYSVAGFPFVDSPAGTAQEKVNAANASPYGAMIGDIQAALNFGYLGGRFDSSVMNPIKQQDIDAYYTSVLLPYAYPYGGARVTNDGFYNPYAGLFYYLSDAYGHPYSDRLAAASPLYSLRAGDTVRITILNDFRLDTPLVKVTDAHKTTLDLTWPTIPNATGYTLHVSPSPSEANGPFSQQAGATQSQPIKGLKPDTAYLISVTANGSSNSKPITSATLPFQGVTQADPASLPEIVESGPDKPSFKLSLNLTPNFSAMSYVVNGDTSPFGNDVSMTGVIGMNLLNLSILDEKQAVVYRGTYFVNLEKATAGNFNVAAPFTLEYNLTPLTQAGPHGTPPYPLGPNLPLTIGTPFNPKPYYRYFDVKFP